MHTSSCRVIALPCVVALTLSSLAPSLVRAQTVTAPASLAEVRAFISSAVDEGAAPSVTVAVTRDDEILWAEGFGYADIAAKRKATPESIYLLASVSKPMIATGLMALVDAGRVDLDKPVGDYLSEGVGIRCYVGDPDAITVRHLTNHTSGMPVHWSFFYDVAPPSREVSIARHAFTCREPGSAYEYCNLAFGIVDHIVARQSGLPFGSYMESAVFDPAGMRSTSDHVRPELAEFATRQYRRAQGGGFDLVAPYGFDHDGASAFWSSALDLTRFLRLHMQRGEIEGTRVLSQESADEMFRVTHHEPGKFDLGVAWFQSEYEGHHSFSHTGGMPGVSTHVRAFPAQNLGIVVLQNGENRNLTTQCMQRIARALLPAVQEPAASAAAAAGTKPNQPNGPTAASAAPSFVGTWSGDLHHPDGARPITLTVAADGDVQIGFGVDSPRALVRVRQDSALRGDLTNVSLPVQAGYHGAVTLRFRLQRSGDRLTGIASAVADRYFCVSHWVDLSLQ